MQVLNVMRRFMTFPPLWLVNSSIDERSAAMGDLAPIRVIRAHLRDCARIPSRGNTCVECRMMSGVRPVHPDV
jgi:hypothetical protein